MDRTSNLVATLEARGRAYKLALLDELEVETDPTLLVFRDDEEVAIATIHLEPAAPCSEPGHLVAPRDPIPA